MDKVLRVAERVYIYIYIYIWPDVSASSKDVRSWRLVYLCPEYLMIAVIDGDRMAFDKRHAEAITLTGVI